MGHIAIPTGSAVSATSPVDAFADVVFLSSSVLWWTLVTIRRLVAVLLVVCWSKDERQDRRALGADWSGSGRVLVLQVAGWMA